MPHPATARPWLRAAAPARPTPKPGEPVLIRFERPVPVPLLRVWRTYVVGGRRVRFFGERWREEDTRHLDFPCHPDPHDPGVDYSWRLFDLETGEEVEPLA